MKNTFPEQFTKKEKDIREIWNDSASLFVFDTNILDNLYRSSDSLRGEFLKVLGDKILKDRIWLPNWVGEEYFNGRVGVISDQIDSYEETIKSVNSLKQNLESSRQHPFVKPKTLSSAISLFDRLSEELEGNKKTHSDRLFNDEIMDSVTNIFEGKVGAAYDIDDLKKIIKDGESRYKEDTPPGYKDKKKHGESKLFIHVCSRYGDLIIWKQILEKSKNEKKNIIFVTDDKKSDWWDIIKGQRVSARKELIKEFETTTEKYFLMYQPDSFLFHAKDYLKLEGITDKMVEEMIEISKDSMFTFSDWLSGESRDFGLESIVYDFESFADTSLKSEFIWKELEAINNYFRGMHVTETETLHELSEAKQAGDDKKVELLKDRLEYLSMETIIVNKIARLLSDELRKDGQI